MPAPRDPVTAPPGEGARRRRRTSEPSRARPHSLDAVEVADRLRPLVLQLHRQLRRETHALGVTAGQVSLMAQIVRRPGIGVGELAAREGVSAPAVCTGLDKLEAAGLVTRTRQGHDGDRRRVDLAVTDEGRAVLVQVRSRRTAWLAARLCSLEPEQLGALSAAVEPLRQVIEQEGG